MLERLQKIIARAGIASRRHAEELITSGQVRVNGVVVTKLGSKADPEHDRVEAAGKVAERPSEVAYYVLHKPAHVVSTMADPEGRATLRHVLRGLSGGIFPVGRLDYDASGLVLLTSDGELANRLFKSSARMPQVYWIKVKGQLSDDLLRQMHHRAQARLRRLMDSAEAKHAAPRVIRKKYASNPWYEAELTEARRDLLRHALFAAEHPVEKMKRVKLGPLDLGTLPEGHYRQLAASEVALLRQAIERAEKAPRPLQHRAAPAATRRPWVRKDRGFPMSQKSAEIPAAAPPGAPRTFSPRVPPRAFPPAPARGDSREAFRGKPHGDSGKKFQGPPRGFKSRPQGGEARSQRPQSWGTKNRGPQNRGPKRSGPSGRGPSTRRFDTRGPGSRAPGSPGKS